jgi:hypothetical protein
MWIDRVLAMQSIADLSAGEAGRLEGAAGSISYWRGDWTLTHRHYAAALDHARRATDRALLAEALYNHAFAPLDVQDFGERVRAGRPWAEQALELYRELGDERGQANANWMIGMASAAEHDLEAARRHLLTADEEYTRLGDAFGSSWLLHTLGLVEARTGNGDVAFGYFERALRNFQGTDDRSGILLVLADLAGLAELEGMLDRAWRLVGAVSAQRDATGVGLVDRTWEIMDWRLPVIPAGNPDAERARDEGAQMTVEAAVAYALERPTA